MWAVAIAALAVGYQSSLAALRPVSACQSQSPLLRPALACGRAAVLRMVDDDDSGGLAGDDISDGDMSRLRARIAKIQENGGALETPSQKFFEIATSKPPKQLMQDFFRSGSPEVVRAMQEAVASLLGALPPFEFDAQMTTTGDKLAALMLQLQMTGYMLRNAEYVLTLRKLLQLRTRSSTEYREAFERIDVDGDGYISIAEVEVLLQQAYPGKAVPAYEIAAFVQLFDTDGDGRVSWGEFAAALGAVDAGDAPSMGSQPMLGGADVSEAAEPRIGGNVTVSLDDGTEVEMDAAAYIAELKQEAQALRSELGQVEAAEQAKQAALASSLSAYVSSLDEPQLQLLTTGISEDVVTAMRQIVTYILRAPSGDGPLERDAEVTMEQAKLQQLCLYQLVLGYTLRESEAKGEADEALGR